MAKIEIEWVDREGMSPVGCFARGTVFRLMADSPCLHVIAGSTQSHVETFRIDEQDSSICIYSFLKTEKVLPIGQLVGLKIGGVERKR